MDNTTNSVNWFEISVDDLDRAKTFYEEIFDFEMTRQNMGNVDFVFFPFEMGSGRASGALAKSEMHKPSGDGAVLYLNGNPNLAPILGRVEAAGGSIIVPKTQISEEVGYMAFFQDSEGNRIALHSQE